MDSLHGLRVAILVANGFEQVEMIKPRQALEAAGASTQIISPASDTVRGWNHDQPADEFPVDVPLDQAKPDDYDALFLPGGVMNPDQLRIDERAVEFVRQMAVANKPIAAICHGPWTLINAGIAQSHTLTSWPSLRVDLINAGAYWVDEAVVVDGRLVTSRKPQDILAFNEAMIKLFAECQQQSEK